MSLPAHLESHHGAQLMAFGPVELAESFGHWPAEYAAMRQRVGLLHLAHKAILRLTGDDRLDFLHRLMTQNLKPLEPGRCARAFQLNVKGRIVADVIVMHRANDTLVECDVFDFDALQKLLDDRLFVEDVQLHDDREGWCILHAIGPAAVKLMHDVSGQSTALLAEPALVHDVQLDDARCVIARCDVGSVTGFRLLVPADQTVTVYDHLLAAMGHENVSQDQADAAYAERRRSSLRGRPVGWSAFNTLRIEEGLPLFHVDYGPDSLPNETGMLDQTVSFTAGCYLGQEVVVRIKDLGHPKRIIVGLSFDGEHLPGSGAQLFAVEKNDDGPSPPEEARPGKEVGAVTSSTPSPLAGQALIGLGMVKWSHRASGTHLLAPAHVDQHGTLTPATVNDIRYRLADCGCATGSADEVNIT